MKGTLAPAEWPASTKPAVHALGPIPTPSSSVYSSTSPTGPLSPLTLLRLRRGEGVGGGADQRAEPVAVLAAVAGDQEIVFRAGIGRGQLDRIAEIGAPRLGRLDEELIVADERDDFAIAVGGVLPEHRARGDVARHAHLLGQERDCLLIRCHEAPFVVAIVLLLLIMTYL